MKGAVGQIRRATGLAPPVLALLLIFRLLIPGGYMIAPDEAGRPGLTICAATASAAPGPAQHSGHDKDPAAPAPKAGELPCPFASLAAPPLTPAPPAVRAPAPVLAAMVSPLPNAPMRRPAPAASPPPATGPPSSD